MLVKQCLIVWQGYKSSLIPFSILIVWSGSYIVQIFDICVKSNVLSNIACKDCMLRVYFLFCRLIKILKDLDGPKWRDKLPKSEEFENVQQSQALPNNQNVASSNPKETSNAKITVEEKEDLNRKSDQKNVEAKKTESREEQFKRIKETGNNFVQQVNFVFVAYFTE